MEEKATMKRSSHGANIRRWREWRGIKQDVLAEKVGVSQSTFCLYEKRDQLDLEVLEKIAKALDIPVEAITEIGDTAAINIINAHDNQSIVNYYPSFNPIDKVVELYDKLLQAEKEKVELLQEVLKNKK